MMRAAAIGESSGFIEYVEKFGAGYQGIVLDYVYRPAALPEEVVRGPRTVMHFSGKRGEKPTVLDRERARTYNFCRTKR